MLYPTVITEGAELDARDCELDAVVDLLGPGAAQRDRGGMAR